MVTLSDLVPVISVVGSVTESNKETCAVVDVSKKSEAQSSGKRLKNRGGSVERTWRKKSSASAAYEL